MFLTCDICSTNAGDVRNINLFTNGSEGINLCLHCQAAVFNIIRYMKAAANMKNLNYAKSLKDSGD